MNICKHCGAPLNTRLRPVADRILALVTYEPNTGCWLWTGVVTRKGYGRIKIGGRKLHAHRLSYEAFVGPLELSQLVLHRCDTPACVNPAHLFLGSALDNNIDASRKGRKRHGEGHPNSVLTDATVKDIRNATGSIASIARQFDIGHQHVRKIRARILWKHIP